MKKLNAVLKSSQAIEQEPKPLPNAFSIHLNGPFTEDDTEAVFHEQQRLVEVMRWFQEFSVLHRKDPAYGDSLPLPHSVYGTVIGLIANQLEQTTEVGLHLTRPSKMR